MKLVHLLAAGLLAGSAIPASAIAVGAIATPSTGGGGGGHPDCPHTRLEVSVEAPTYTVPDLPGWVIDSVWSKAGSNPHINHGALAPGTTITSGEFNENGRERDISHVDICKSPNTPPTDPEVTDPEPTDPEPTDPTPTEPESTEPDPTEPDPTEPVVDYCDPTQRPGGQSIGQWVPLEVKCVDLVVVATCGAVGGEAIVDIHGVPWAGSYQAMWSEGDEADYGNGQVLTLDPGVTFEYGHNDGQTTVWVWIEGAEADYVTGRSIPNFWEQNALRVDVDTECTPEPTEPTEPTEPSEPSEPTDSEPPLADDPDPSGEDPVEPSPPESPFDEDATLPETR